MACINPINNSVVVRSVTANITLLSQSPIFGNFMNHSACRGVGKFRWCSAKRWVGLQAWFGLEVNSLFDFSSPFLWQKVFVIILDIFFSSKRNKKKRPYKYFNSQKKLHFPVLAWIGAPAWRHQPIFVCWPRKMVLQMGFHVEDSNMVEVDFPEHS